MARVRFAEIVVVAAVAGSLAACGGGSSKQAAAPGTSTSTSQAAPPSSSATTPVSAASTTAANTATSVPPSTQSVTVTVTEKSSTASQGDGVANAGDRVTIVGKLQYLAPGKYLVHPDDGSTDQGFYVSDSTQILGAAAICGGPDGNVTINADDYGTTKCTQDELEAASKSNAVRVRVTMDPKTGTVYTVEEKYHP